MEGMLWLFGPVIVAGIAEGYLMGNVGNFLLATICSFLASFVAIMNCYGLDGTTSNVYERYYSLFTSLAMLYFVFGGISFLAGGWAALHAIVTSAVVIALTIIFAHFEKYVLAR